MSTLVLGLCCSAQAFAQQPMTLDDAIATAVQNSPSLATQKVAEQSAEQARVREKTRYVPLANAEGGIRRGTGRALLPLRLGNSGVRRHEPRAQRQ
jgi:hypothetical protein